MPPAIKRKKGEGQWALGYREPLNGTEEQKKNDDGLNVRQRIIDIYSKQGFDSIDPVDLRGRFRWMGLYTQRRPGIDGGRTAVLEEEELDDRFFMMRVRSDGRLLSSETVRARLSAQADLVDMEGYAVASAARAAGVSVRLVKHVSDTADEGAGAAWKDSVESCARDLAAWVITHL